MTTTKPDVDLTDGAFYAGDSRADLQMDARERTGLPGPQRLGRRGDIPGRDRGRAATPSCSPTPAASGPTSRRVPMMIEMDDPQHLLRRKLVNSGFTRKRVKDLEARSVPCAMR